MGLGMVAKLSKSGRNQEKNDCILSARDLWREPRSFAPEV